MKTTNLVICAMAVAGFLTATAKPVFQPDVFDTATPFPEIVKTSPGRKENLSRRVKTIDGKERETMYVDYFVLRPGAKGEVRATAMDGSPICVRGDCGIGKVFFN